MMIHSALGTTFTRGHDVQLQIWSMGYSLVLVSGAISPP